MAVIENVVDAPPDRVYAVLADGWTYGDWVVGISHVSRVEADWPSVGSALHYQVGAGLATLRATATVLSTDPPYELAFRPHLWPLGEYVVRIMLTPVDEGRTKIVFAEHLVAGPLYAVRRRPSELMLHLRGRETVRRLADFAMHRPLSAAGDPIAGS